MHVPLQPAEPEPAATGRRTPASHHGRARPAPTTTRSKLSSRLPSSNPGETAGGDEHARLASASVHQPRGRLAGGWYGAPRDARAAGTPSPAGAAREFARAGAGRGRRTRADRPTRGRWLRTDPSYSCRAAAASQPAPSRRADGSAQWPGLRSRVALIVAPRPGPRGCSRGDQADQQTAPHAGMQHVPFCVHD
ncbi:hypothetical protein PVAP13_4KG173000 [Panicum virgatum]|uniref:Uncharacterized protein n=1 Tax=Panicum virgatum TaxID=38727 RepID=A0A8T0TNI8_PANVG|nr:hypothetical protein PVAP13_4KG173000 [Panicum virgatum]